MKKGRLAFLLLFAVFAAASVAEAKTAKAVFQPTQEGSNISGEITLSSTETGLKIEGNLRNLPPGKHGFHIHEFGSCAENGGAAGGHFNPFEVQHGYLPDDHLSTAHAGDLGNIEADDSGNASVDYTVEGLHLEGLPYGVLGRAFIVHERPDDFGQPTGNAGGRIACGPIVLVEK